MPSPTWLRPTAFAIAFAGLILGITDIARALRASVPLDETAPIILHGSFVLLALVGLAAILLALAAVIDSASATPPEKNSAISDTIVHIREALDQLPSNLSTLLTVNTQEHPERQSAPAALPTDLVKAMERMVELLEEIREAATMDESQRQARQRALRDRSKAATIADASSAIQGRQWARADKLIAGLEADYPVDASIAELHRQLAAGRSAAEGEAAAKIRANVEDLMAISSWDEAYAMALEFAENFPQNDDGAALLQRVTRERDIFNESTVHQLYEEIKSDLERRRWRRTLAGAQRLLERFPDHRKTVKIRAQLRTIQDNAEIEERQEQEAKIQDLIRSKRFSEAIELAEHLLDRFPLSPQAGSLEELLPKMRELAMQQAIEAEAAQHR
jgi:hypothetical protein